MDACKNCKHWLASGEIDTSDTGSCRRFPPVPINLLETAFPSTRENSRCGEFSLDAEREAEIKRVTEIKMKARAEMEAKVKAALAEAQGPSVGSVSVAIDTPVGANVARSPVMHVSQLKKFQSAKASSSAS